MSDGNVLPVGYSLFYCSYSLWEAPHGIKYVKQAGILSSKQVRSSKMSIKSNLTLQLDLLDLRAALLEPQSGSCLEAYLYGAC